MALSEQLHASAIEVDGRGVLLLGDAGSGKSDLALRLIDRGARLVADDRVDLAREDGRMVMSAPDRLAGLIEVRGLGIFRIDRVARSPLWLAVRLIKRDSVDRLGERSYESLLDTNVSAIRIDPFEISAPIKIEWALRQAPISVEARL